jgi:hypothetical protein
MTTIAAANVAPQITSRPEPATTVATEAPRAGGPHVLATYACDEGERRLVGQRIDGVVRITDRRPGGRSYLVEAGFDSMAEIEALVADYLAKAATLGYAPMQGWF